MSELNEQGASPLTLLEETDVDSSGTSVAPSLGKQLLARREAEGWSVEEVAAQLKLAPRQIVAMETDRLDMLPGATVARGFVRIYARLLNMDPVPLLSALNSADTHSSVDSIREQRPLSTPFTKTHLPSMRTRRASRSVIVFLLIIGLIGAVFAALQMNWVPLPASVTAVFGQGQVQNSSPVPTPPSAPVSVSPAPPMPVAPRGDESSSEVPSDAGNSNLDAAGKSTFPEPATSDIKAPVVAPETKETSSVAPAATGLLTVVFHQDSWIEIRRKNGTAIMSRLAKAGTTESVQIDEPVTLIIGNVSGVEARLRDVPLDLKSGTTTNVARVNLK